MNKDNVMLRRKPERKGDLEKEDKGRKIHATTRFAKRCRNAKNKESYIRIFTALLVVVTTASACYAYTIYYGKRCGLLDDGSCWEDIELYWEKDHKGLVLGDDDYSQRIFLHTPPEEKEHKMPVTYASSNILEDIDLSKRSSCGVTKCFWPSLRSPSNVGYLLTTEGYYDGLYYAYDVAQDIAENCGVKHLIPNDSPVVLVNVTESFMTKLARLVFNPMRTKLGQKSPFVFYPKDTVLVIQKVMVAPTPYLLFGTGAHNWPAMVRNMPEFRQKLSLIDSITRQQLKKRLEQEAKGIECVFQRYPTYWSGFQGFIDTKGNFYFMDMDEVYYTTPSIRSKNQRKQKRCLKYFHLMIQGLTMEEFDETQLLSSDE